MLFFFFKLAINNRYTVSLFKYNYEPEYHSFSSGALPELRQVPFSSEHILLTRNECNIQWSTFIFFPSYLKHKLEWAAVTRGLLFPGHCLCIHLRNVMDHVKHYSLSVGLRSSGNPQSNSCSNALENLFRPTLNTFYFFCLCQLLLSEASLLFSKSLLLKWS